MREKNYQFKFGQECSNSAWNFSIFEEKATFYPKDIFRYFYKHFFQDFFDFLKYTYFNYFDCVLEKYSFENYFLRFKLSKIISR